MSARPSDAELVRRVRAGDGSAFVTLMQCYERPVRSRIAAREFNPSVADELFQEAFLRAFIGLHKKANGRGGLKDASKFSGWLNRIADNVAASESRRHAKRGYAVMPFVAFNDGDADGEQQEPAGPQPEPDNASAMLRESDLAGEISRLAALKRNQLAKAQLEEELRLAQAMRDFVDGLPRDPHAADGGGFALFTGLHKDYVPPSWPPKPGKAADAVVRAGAKPRTASRTGSGKPVRIEPQIQRVALPDWNTAAEMTDVPIDTPADQFVAVMRLLAVMAYPDNWEQRDRAMLAMHVLMLRAAKHAGRKLPPGASALFAEMKTQQQHRTLKTVSERVNSQLYAARVVTMLLLRVHRPKKVRPMPARGEEATAYRWLGEVLSSGEARARALKDAAGDRYTLNDYAKHGPGTEAAFKSRLWRPEILHFSKSLATIADHWDDPRGFGIFTMLANPGWVVAALESAERLAQILAVAGQTIEALSGIRPERQVRLVPAVAISEPPGGPV